MGIGGWVDTFTFMVALLLMMLAIQFDEKWLAFSIIAITILSLRSVKATVMILVAAGILFAARSVLEPYWPYVFFGLIILALLLGSGGKEQPEYYSPDMYAGLMGGGGGGY
jgi:hypothetical protein